MWRGHELDKLKCGVLEGEGQCVCVCIWKSVFVCVWESVCVCACVSVKAGLNMNVWILQAILQVVDKIPTIATQLKIIAAVKATRQGGDGKLCV